MQNKIGSFFFFITFLIIVAACRPSPTPTATPQAAQPEGRKLVIGDISDEVAETINGTQPLADYLATQLSEFGITGAEVKIAPDMDTMIQWVNNGEVDIYFDSPYPALVIRDATGA
ncbi:MAG TPA: phosphate ABC transporter substrate-binding protein, partial [Chloroflexi bacterium]|nr:phosphate ABC transporter substrate-binding protein [Chloroflexota bacterium]